MNRNILIALVVIVVILAATLGYFIFQNQKLIKQVTSSPSPATQTQISPPVSASPQPSPSEQLTLAQLQDNIKASVNSGNFAALISYMTEPVQIILQATECCGPLSQTEAGSQLDYVSSGVPFDFNQGNPTIANLKAKNVELAGKFIGISQGNEHLIAFGINAQNQITDIRMSVSWMLFNN